MLEKTYAPQDAERRSYRFWEDNGLFRPEVNAPDAPAFSMVIPPPNVTGTLHIGHALDNTLQDILTRWHRMRGERTLWMPGTDHAGIATQNVVERKLRESGKTKFDLGREAFVDEVWDWAKACQGDILGQFRRLGISPDWSRQRFTLDEGLSRSVREAFVTLYEQDKIYRGTYIVNWCPRCTSAISDIETEYAEEDSFMWEISYPLAEGMGALRVATTRPETLYGDVAVAVSPTDPRYKDLIGQMLVLPLSNVQIPIIADDYVDASFGTGAVKITPAHDPNDYEVGKRHKLTPIFVMDESGKMKADEPRVPEDIRGMDRAAARQRTEELLSLHGFLMDKKPHKHNVGHCQRCGTTIEPLLSQQWFVRTPPLAEEALSALDAGDIRFIPDRWTKVYRDWMTNIRDWCISRQLWWGHRIPAWYCDDCDAMIVSKTDPTACTCGSTNLHQDPDVLDTWFSSGLWPFSTMGWPDADAPDFKTYFPTSVLVTGFDIIFFWVARMTMMSHGLTGKSPFSTVYIHGLVRDAQGQKMSKSKGNTIDPVEVIDEYGCDAMRFSLTSLVTGGQDIKLSKDSFEQGKLFANKLWNASRFVMMNLEDADNAPIDRASLSRMDSWILARLDDTAGAVDKALTDYRFSDVADYLYKFLWNDFCDWYVEYAKKGLRDPATKANTQRILRHVLDNALRLLHPVMPHVTETLWQALTGNDFASKPSLSVAPFPTAAADADEALMTEVSTVIEMVRTIRNVRQSSGVPHPHPTPVTIEAKDPTERQAFLDNANVLHHFLKLASLDIVATESLAPADAAVGVLGQSRVLVSLAGAVDLDAERARQQKDLEKFQKEHTDLSARLGNPGFVDRAPADVVAKNRDRLTELDGQIRVLQERLTALNT